MFKSSKILSIWPGSRVIIITNGCVLDKHANKILFSLSVPLACDSPIIFIIH